MKMRMNRKFGSTRRTFMKTAAATVLTAGTVRNTLSSTSQVPPSDRIGIATIGMGGMGFGDTRTALRVSGVEFVAAADCYNGRLVRTREVFGDQVFTTRDYREVLERDDVDAVIVATTDHWHTQCTVDALEAGKHVYCEKPMMQKIEEASQIIQAQERTGKICQVGSQYVSSILYEKVRELYRAGEIGQLNMVEAWINRNTALGAWQYTIPPDASTKTVDWDRYLGNAPKRPFDPLRFFRWRNYWDYGTGIPGDLFVHLLSALHFVLDSNGPVQVMASGGLRYWKDGRDVPDLMMALCEYSATDAHPEFTLSLKVNFADGSNSGSGFRFIGDEGMLDIDLGGSVSLRRSPRPEAPGLSIGTFPEAMQQQIQQEYRRKYPESKRPSFNESAEKTYRTPSGYDMRLDHFRHFFDAIRTEGRVVEDAVFGARAAAPALLCNTSYREERVCGWDPVQIQERT